MKKRVLLVSTPYMGIYQDIINGLEGLGFEVEFISQKSFPNNPNLVLHKKVGKEKREQFQNVLEKYWKGILDYRKPEDLYFDYLFVINGLTIHPYLFEKLRGVNQNVVAVNYIYDRIKGVYQIDQNFKYFDSVFSFDRSDVKEYNLFFLPIYWVPVKGHISETYDFFAFGGIDPVRVGVFKRIKRIVDSNKLKGFVKVYHPRVGNSLMYTVRRIGKYVLQHRKSPSLKELKTDLYTSDSVSTEQFRIYLNSSKVVVDTNHSYQDGMTARFMWALGAGKKILTNNIHVKDYDFFSKEQIMILEDFVSDDDILSFLHSESIVPADVKAIIEKYRIDNWLRTILGIK